LRFLIVFQAFE